MSSTGFGPYIEWWRALPRAYRGALAGVTLLVTVLAALVVTGVSGDRDPAPTGLRLADAVERGAVAQSAGPAPARSSEPDAYVPGDPVTETRSGSPAATTAIGTPAAAVSYPDCAAAVAAGAAPIPRGRPGYRTGLDRDLDGVACDEDPGGTSTPSPTTTVPATTVPTTEPPPTTDPPTTEPTIPPTTEPPIVP